MRIRITCTFIVMFVATCGITEAAKPATTTKAITKPPTHPVVVAFERFSVPSKTSDPATANGVGSDVELGRLLLGELNCSSCHELNASTRAAILPKQAPVLSDVGARVKPEWLRAVLNSPRHAKPGTTMPNMLGSLKPEERTKQVEALVHFLVSTSARPPVDQAPDKTAIEHGESLFHEAGCVACHGARTKDAVVLNTSIPLGEPAAKYSIASLAKFLRDPTAVRPSGRMPSLNLTDQEGYDLAHYFLRDVTGTPPNLNYAYFEGDFKNVGDFATKGSKTTGTCLGFDLGVAQKRTVRHTLHRVLADSEGR